MFRISASRASGVGLQSLGVGLREPRAWDSEPRAWDLEPRAWDSEPRVWDSEPRAWDITFGDRWRAPRHGAGSRSNTSGSCHVYSGHVPTEHVLSATINYHEDLGFEGPAEGRAAGRMLKGVDSIQVQVLEDAGQQVTERTWLPAWAVPRVHELVLGCSWSASRDSLRILRACTYTVVPFYTFGRPETGVGLLQQDVATSLQHIGASEGNSRAAGADKAALGDRLGRSERTAGSLAGIKGR
ncbi:hypothetical protein CYMTET_56758 [Cymbomonas tetramitiformis]|uniref:Uncharacterized protein n=1 Tax=Cymbomonas tetramitiformis TaxID=36881 RepID=A0AAE0BBK2_9CHLO|nr:hypothetical protein CYMTET_56758 [Cymbomonas tetramitiformis]